MCLRFWRRKSSIRLEVSRSSCSLTSWRRRVAASVSPSPLIAVAVLDRDCLVGYRRLKVMSSNAFCSNTNTLSRDQNQERKGLGSTTHNSATQSCHPLVHNSTVMLLNDSVSPSHPCSINGLAVLILLLLAVMASNKRKYYQRIFISTSACSMDTNLWLFIRFDFSTSWESSMNPSQAFHLETMQSPVSTADGLAEKLKH